jgi:hypothetical protein
VTADSRPAVPCTVETRTTNTAWQRFDAARLSNPEEITEGDWHHARNMLPVVGWCNDANGESFKVPERLQSDAATIYVRINDRHFLFVGGIQTPHSECCRRVAQSKAYAEPRMGCSACVSTWADDRLP